jgi:hypothetical protein
MTMPFKGSRRCLNRTTASSHVLGVSADASDQSVSFPPAKVAVLGADACRSRALRVNDEAQREAGPGGR